MFGLSKPKASDIINNFQQQAFSAWGIQNADIATRLRFKAALGIYTSILLSTTNQSRTSIERVSNEILKKIIATTEGDRCQVSEIFSISNKVKCINFSQSKFLAVANLSSANVNINGLGVLDNLAQAFGVDCAAFLQGREGGEIINAGMILMKDLTVGDADKGDVISSMLVSQHYMEFFEKIMSSNK